MGIATTAEQLALQRSVQDWAAGAELTARARAAVHDRAVGGGRGGLWPQVAGLGLIGAGLPEELGGFGGTLTDAAVALEAAGRALIPGPLLPTVLAALLLARHADQALAGSAVPALVEGHRTGAVAPDADPVAAEALPDGGLRLDGVVPVLLGAEPGAVLLLPARTGDGVLWVAVDGTAIGLTLQELEPFDLSTAACAVRLSGVTVPAGHVLSGLADQQVRELAAALAAAEAAGIAGWALEVATDYAKVREQFGRPIGSFQAVKHLCAGMLCRREEAVAVAWDAARAVVDAGAGGPAGDPAEVSLAAAVAAAVALDAAVLNANDCIQVLGGIGFTWEHDAHLYYRRALALRQWLGGSGTWRARAASLVRAGARRTLALPADAEPTHAELDLRRDIRALVSRLPADPQRRRAKLADSGFLVPHWPAPYGVGASAREQLIIEEELDAAGVVRPELGIAAWAVPTIVLHGDDAQRERFVRPTLRGEITWCQLFSEPEAGSDLASLRTRAVRVEGGWSLTGQKVWTSLAHTADWGICLARTDPDAARPHAGISYFLVDMRSAGIEARPLREMTGEALFNEVFLNDVFVPDDCLVGPVNGGWKLARATLAQERVSIGGSSALDVGMERLLAMKGIDHFGDDRLGGLIGRGSAVSLIGVLATARRLVAEDGGKAAPPGPESSVIKLLGVRHRQEVAEAAYELLAEAGLAVGPESRAVQQELLTTRCLSIAGGTTQVLLTLAAEMLLGLPRERNGGKA